MAIDNLKQIISFAIKIQKALELSLQDGKFEVKDVATFVPVFLELPNVISAAQAVKSDFKMGMTVNMNELKEHFAKEFDIHDDKLEKKIESSVSFVLGLVEFYHSMKS